MYLTKSEIIRAIDWIDLLCKIPLVDQKIKIFNPCKPKKPWYEGELKNMSFYELFNIISHAHVHTGIRTDGDFLIIEAWEDD